MVLRTLGGLSLRGADFKRPKPLLLLAFLALEGPQERRYLAELFWPNAADPRQSLTVALSQLHSADPNLVRFERPLVHAGVACDAVLLKDAAANHEWERVAELYEGTFLAGVDAEPGNLELEEWLYANRELLALTVQGALIELADLTLAAGDSLRAGQLAERAATLVPSAEGEARRLQRLHALLVATNSPRAAALRREADMLGIQLPERSSRRLRAASHNLPSNRTPFIGREEELTTLQALVYEGARLITITGLGGMGKTRLAVELGRRLANAGRYAQVHFLPLSGAAADEQFAPLLASTLGRQNRGRRASDTVVDDPDQRRVLLVGDDLGPTPASREQIEALLGSMPQLDVVLTAREPLGSLAETQFQLAGLALATSAQGSGEPSDALALYIKTARRFDMNFSPDAEDALTVCQLVAGSPLGIELAASLASVLSPADLLSELRLSLDVLDAGQGSLPERHHSVRAVFDSSWARLGAAERAALAGCGLFQGGFTRSAASEVLGLDLRQLGALLERSLLRRQGGRFELHPLVRQYAREKLDAFPEAEPWRERHASYYVALFASKRLFMQRSGQRQALEELETEFPNLQEAWQWAVGAARTDLLEKAAFMTARFLFLRGRTSEMSRLLQLADSASDKDSLLHAQVLRWQAVLMGWEDPVGAQQLLNDALAIHEALKREDDLGALYYHLGLVSAFRGDPDAASAHWRAAIPRLEQRDDEELLGAAYSHLSLVTAQAEEHEALARRAHALCLKTGAAAQLAICYANEAGEAHYAYGDSATAVACLEKAIELEASEGGRDDYLERFYSRQAYELVNLGDFARAEQRLTEAYSLIAERDTGNYPDEPLYPPIELTAAQLHDARGEFQAARAEAERAPTDRLCRELLCRLALHAGDTAQAGEHLAMLGTLRGYGFTVRARLHERGVEMLLTGDLARARCSEAMAAGNAQAAAQLRREALRAFADTLGVALTYTFAPLALEVFTATYALDPHLGELVGPALAARHPASRYYVRRRAGSLLPSALPSSTETLVAGWLQVPPRELVPVVTKLAEALAERLAAAA